MLSPKMVRAAEGGNPAAIAAVRPTGVGSWEVEVIDPAHLEANPLKWSDEMFRLAGYEPGDE